MESRQIGMRDAILWKIQLALEKVQQHATKLVPFNHPYDKRLLMFTIYRYRRRRGNMIITYSILTNRVNIKQTQFFHKITLSITIGATI